MEEESRNGRQVSGVFREVNNGGTIKEIKATRKGAVGVIRKADYIAEKERDRGTHKGTITTAACAINNEETTKHGTENMPFGTISKTRPEVFWSANWNMPLKENATLEFSGGNLLLIDEKGQEIIWSSQTSGMSTYGMKIDENGNLILFNQHFEAVWKSSNHPTDTLLLGQVIALFQSDQMPQITLYKIKILMVVMRSAPRKMAEAEPKKATSSGVDSKSKEKGLLLDEEFGKDFRSSWKSMPVTESEYDAAYSSGIISKGNKKASNSDKLSSKLDDHYFRIKYKNEKLIGSGAFGLVYSCEDEKGNKFAKKIVNFNKAEKEETLREVAIMKHLDDHPSIIKYHEYWIEDVPEPVGNGGKDCRLHLIMDYCPSTLAGVIAKKGAEISDSKIISWFRQIILGLEHLEAKGVIHNDLSSNNIFLDQEDHIKIGDLGLSKRLDVVGTCTKIQISTDEIGTDVYAGPEKKNKETLLIDFRSDIFSAGVILFELLYPMTEERSWTVLKRLGKDRKFPKDFKHKRVFLLRLLTSYTGGRPLASVLLRKLDGVIEGGGTDGDILSRILEMDPYP
ncbi:hypothetical protein CCACVL1_08242 [Corchorus capsularis]|uniref:Protein kinase domain-containing protein n=1 Tax=Corchorus capsularis TaxID=210143 RepID=A0A1R3J1N3_COCAP|nr:hypothetical protein CCACVL1_08242 [Corchorus capsularis]